MNKNMHVKLIRASDISIQGSSVQTKLMILLGYKIAVLF